MIKKLSIAGGVAAASVASAVTLAPTGNNLQKESKPKTEEEIKAEQARKERQDFISKSDAAVNELNESSESKDRQLSFLKNSDEEDKWKLMWIYDLWNYYKKEEARKTVKENVVYIKEEIPQFEKAYWDNQVFKQQGKWVKGIEDKLLNQANAKNQYWEKFKEICLILTMNGKIDKDKNMNTSNSDGLLCVYADFHTTQFESYETYKKDINNPPLGIMEHFWTVSLKSSQTTNKSS